MLFATKNVIRTQQTAYLILVLLATDGADSSRVLQVARLVRIRECKGEVRFGRARCGVVIGPVRRSHDTAVAALSADVKIATATVDGNWEIFGWRSRLDGCPVDCGRPNSATCRDATTVAGTAHHGPAELAEDAGTWWARYLEAAQVGNTNSPRGR